MNEKNSLGLKKILDKYTFINIYGKAGTGKTTFALQLIANLLTYPEVNNTSSVWIQTSDSFPKTRLESLYSDKKNLLDHLLRHIFVIPKRPAADYYQQNSMLANIFHSRKRIPPTTRALVIDNISHHLRFALSQFDAVGDKVAILDDFFDSVIIPLSFFCEQSRIILILIHEVSYDPSQDKTVMFNDQVFSRLNSLDIELKKDLFSKKHYIHFHTQNTSKSYEYTVLKKGISILS